MAITAATKSTFPAHFTEYLNFIGLHLFTLCLHLNNPPMICFTFCIC